MSEKQKMCTVVDLPTSILASLFAALMIYNQFPLLTMFPRNIRVRKLRQNRMIAIHSLNVTAIWMRQFAIWIERDKQQVQQQNMESLFFRRDVFFNHRCLFQPITCRIVYFGFSRLQGLCKSSFFSYALWNKLLKESFLFLGSRYVFLPVSPFRRATYGIVHLLCCALINWTSPCWFFLSDWVSSLTKKSFLKQQFILFSFTEKYHIQNLYQPH